jgi:release factor glutamine methyltransferase
MKLLKNWSSMRELIKAVSDELTLDRSDAELVIATLMNCSRSELYVGKTLDSDDRNVLWSQIDELKQGKPIEYLSGRVRFRDHVLKILPGVFIPRVETEYFCELITQHMRWTPERILEIGTGCGAISIALAHLYPDALIFATDISERALENAKQNVRELALQSRINIVRCNMYHAIDSEFDLIVANPPYVPHARVNVLPKSVRDFEPLAAIDGGNDGVEFIHELIRTGIGCLSKRGTIALEIDEESVNKLTSFLYHHDINSFVFEKDLFKRPRFLFIGANSEKSKNRC